MLKVIDRVLAFDTETTGLWPYPTLRRQQLGIAPDRPFLFQVANMDGDAVSFRAKVNPKTREVTYGGCKKELRWLKGVIADPHMRIVCHNAGFERRQTTQEDLAFNWRCKIDDTKHMARVCNPTTEPVYSLKPLAWKYLGIPDDDLKALHKKLASARRQAKARGWCIATKETHGQKPMYADYWLPEVEQEVKEYGECDPIRTIGLWMMYRDILARNKAEGGKLHEIYSWERRVLKTALRMEREGMTYLADAGVPMRKEYTEYMRTHKRAMIKLGYPNINPQSPKQMKDIFITALKRKPTATTKTGQLKIDAGLLSEKEAFKLYPKIDAEQLMAWARGSAAGADVDGDGPDGCKLSRALLEWKAGKKVLEYIEAYDFFSCARDDGSVTLHPAWDPAGARTGRWSCHDPNTMQIASAETSRRHSLIRARQRELFGPRPNYLWYMPDYSQIEVWCFAFVAKEKAMMKALLRGNDFHLATADAAWGSRPNFCTCGRWKEVQQEMARNPKFLLVWDIEKAYHKKGCFIKWWRQRAKMLLFSRLYGGGLGKVAFLIRCTVEEAREFIEEFNEKLPGVQGYMDSLSEEIRETGRLVNLFGREYELDKSKAYKGVNYMVQGSCAEIMKRAVVRTDEHLRTNYPADEQPDGSYVIGTVHDELIAEIAEEHHSGQLMQEIVKIMQMDSHYIPNLKVPLPVGMKFTRTNWSAATDVKRVVLAAA